MKRTAFTLIELIVVIVIILILLAILFPAVQSAKEASSRLECKNYVKQIALGFHNYNAIHGSLPPAYAIDQEGHLLFGWRVHILPFIEEQNLYKQFHYDEAWDGGHNIVFFGQRPAVYQCPQQYRFQGQPGDCPYAMIVGQDTISDGPNAIKFSDITDGTSNTILVAETRKNIPWSSPGDISFNSLSMGIMTQNDPRATKDGMCSRHKKPGVNTAFADGSVRVVSPQIQPKTLQFMAMINDGEKIDMDHLEKP